jgi:hypothetical protein
VPIKTVLLFVFFTKCHKNFFASLFKPSESSVKLADKIKMLLTN